MRYCFLTSFPCSIPALLHLPSPVSLPSLGANLKKSSSRIFFEFTITAACYERSSLAAKRYEATSSRSDGKLKSIAENRSGVEVKLQQGEDHRRPWSIAHPRFVPRFVTTCHSLHHIIAPCLWLCCKGFLYRNTSLNTQAYILAYRTESMSSMQCLSLCLRSSSRVSNRQPVTLARPWISPPEPLRPR